MGKYEASGCGLVSRMINPANGHKHAATLFKGDVATAESMGKPVDRTEPIVVTGPVKSKTEREKTCVFDWELNEIKP